MLPQVHQNLQMSNPVAIELTPAGIEANATLVFAHPQLDT